MKEVQWRYPKLGSTCVILVNRCREVLVELAMDLFCLASVGKIGELVTVG